MRILLTGAGGPAAIGVARSLAHHDLVGMDRDKYALRHAPMERVYVGPSCNEPGYLPFLNELVDRERIDLVHAQPDPEVLFLSEHRHEVVARTFLPSQATVRTCQDKMETFNVLSRRGVPVPQSYLLPNEVRLNQVWDLLMPGVGKMWLRATTGAAGRGAYFVHGFGRFPEAVAWIESQNGWGSFMAAEYLPGRCVTWQSLWHKGELIASQGRERLEWHLANRSPSGVTGVTGVGRTTNRRDLDDVGRRAVLAIDPRPDGIFGVDMKENAEGTPCVTEINIGRFFTTIEFFARLGLNFPDLYVRCATGEKIPPQPKIADGWLWVRSMDSLPVLIHESALA